MIKIIEAEYLKTKRSMRQKLIWGCPVITFAVALILTLGMTNSYAESVWNWWYSLLMQGMIAIICYLSMKQEKKANYYHLMTLPVSRKKLMLGKIIFMGCVVFIANIIIFTGASLGGFLLTTRVPVKGAAAAVFLLTIAQLWEIPVALFLSEKFGMIPELLICLFLTVCGVIVAQTGKWYWLISAVPMRIVCPFLHILPNGLWAEEGHPLLSGSVVLPGLCLSVIWFIVITVLFLKWFDKREVK